MSEAGARAKEPERSAASSPPAGWHETRARGQKEAADDDTNSSDAVKTDHEILSVALRDIDLINSALSTEAPSTELKNGRNVMAAYRDFMKKGRKLGEMRRPWEDKPDDKLFDRGIRCFSEFVQEYSSCAKENPDLAKRWRLSQHLDYKPQRFEAKNFEK